MANSVLEALTWVPLTKGSAPAHSPPCTGCSWQTRCSSAAAHSPSWHLPKHSQKIPIYYKIQIWYHCTLNSERQYTVIPSIPWFLTYLRDDTNKKQSQKISVLRIRDVYPDPISKFFHSGTWIHGQKDSGSALKNLRIFIPKYCFSALGNMIRDVPGSRSCFYYLLGSRIQGSKRPRIPDPQQ